MLKKLSYGENVHVKTICYCFPIICAFQELLIENYFRDRPSETIEHIHVFKSLFLIYFSVSDKNINQITNPVFVEISPKLPA